MCIVSQTIKRRMQKELGVIIQHTTQQIVEYHPPAPPDDPPISGHAYLKADSRDAKLLQELLQVSICWLVGSGGYLKCRLMYVCIYERDISAIFREALYLRT